MTKVAVIQAATCLFDTPATLEKLARLAGEAAAQGAKLVLFPEAFVGGYPKGMDFWRAGWFTNARGPRLVRALSCKRHRRAGAGM